MSGEKRPKRPSASSSLSFGGPQTGFRSLFQGRWGSVSFYHLSRLGMGPLPELARSLSGRLSGVRGGPFLDLRKATSKWLPAA